MANTAKEMEYSFTFQSSSTLITTDWFDGQILQAFLAAINAISDRDFKGVPLLQISVQGQMRFINLIRCMQIIVNERETGIQVHTEKPQGGFPTVVSAVDSKDKGEKEIMS